MGSRYDGEFDWARKAECSKPENKEYADYFFSADVDKKYAAKNLCFSCDVRKECITWALENKEIWGVWGGREPNEIRRTLSVSAEGTEIRRGRYPQCPYCFARTSRLMTKVIQLPNGGRWTTARAVECRDCGFEWRSRSSANAVDAYYLDREERKARAERRRQIAVEKARRARAKPAKYVRKPKP